MVSATGKQDRRGFEMMINLGIGVSILGLIGLFVVSWWICLIIILLGILVATSAEVVSRPPTNNPSEFLRFFRSVSHRRPVVACVGDSITHGKCSADFTSMIAPKLAERLKVELPALSEEEKKTAFENPVWVVNCGQNFLPSYTLLNERLYYALACYPDYVILMIGTNDVLGIYSSWYKSSLMGTWNLRDEPSMENFKANITGIIDFIRKTSPMTQIGICTLPPLSEDLTSEANRYIKQANAILYSVVNDDSSPDGANADGRVSIIPVYEKMEDTLMSQMKSFNNVPVSFGPTVGSFLVPLRHFLGLPYNTMSKWFSQRFLVDSIHLNEDGAQVVSEQIVQWLFGRNIHKAIAVKSY